MFRDNNPTATFIFGVTAGISVAAIMNFIQNYMHPAPVRRSSLIPTIPSSSALAKLEKEFNISSEMLHKIARQMVSEMKRGLASEGQTLKMIPSFVTKRPTGSESGSYLALDLGGSNFRVCEVTLLGGALAQANQQLVRVRQKKFTVSEELKKGDGDKLFDFFAECIRLFVDEIRSEGGQEKELEEQKLGFTFSFPVHQVAVDKGICCVFHLYYLSGRQFDAVDKGIHVHGRRRPGCGQAPAGRACPQGTCLCSCNLSYTCSN
jgi:hypothetical protein